MVTPLREQSLVAGYNQQGTTQSPLRVLVAGGDGYLGWPTAMSLAMAGHEVTVVDSYLRRSIARETGSEALLRGPKLEERSRIFSTLSGRQIHTVEGDLTEMPLVDRLFERCQPDAVVHYAEQPSAPYSMMGFEEANLTLMNNLGVTMNLIWGIVNRAPKCHLIKLGTMGEYGTPNIDIEEGWIDVHHKGRRDKFLFPRQAGSLYHTTKILDTDLLWFYVRTYGLRVTDLMQGPVYGLSTAEADLDERLMPNFHYDDIFGTVVNRFLAQAVIGMPLTVYGEGRQRRGYLNLIDTLQCVELAMKTPPAPGNLRILNQFVETFSVLELADLVYEGGRRVGLQVEIKSVENPRVESEDHYYNPAHTGLLDLGLEPHFLTSEVVAETLERLLRHRGKIDKKKMLPRVRWPRSVAKP